MYIEPNTIIRVLKNVPLDKTYDHTIYFDNEGAQANYFIGKTKFTFDRQTYQRVNKGSMKIARQAEELYDCNYIMFQNSAFGSKWFYAFITSVEYVNNSTSQITFEIDVMQTWFFDYELGESFVEREHSATDLPWENTIPENLELGEYVADDFLGTEKGGTDALIVSATFYKDGDSYIDHTGGLYGGIFSGCYYTVFTGTSRFSDCAAWIDGAVAAGKGDGIVNVFQMSSDFVTELGEGVNTYPLSIGISSERMGVNGYVPRNKKLLCYPFNFLYVSNMQGNSAIFRYEFFKISGNAVQFMIVGDMSPDPSIVLAPYNYGFNFANEGNVVNYDEKITLKGFPQCSWNTDTFKAWLAQNGASLAVNTLGGILGASASMALAKSDAGAVGGAIAGFNAVAGTVAQVYEHAKMPSQAHGAQGNITLAAVGLLDFAIMHKHIRDEYAKIIDDFFDMYGYATNRTKVPNRNVRPHWCFTKTASCVIHGSCPADDEKKICEIYNNGITFWKNGDEVGNYSLDNRV